MSRIALPDGSVRADVLADPYELYAGLREHAPVVFDSGVNGWLVSRYDDVRASALDERLLARRSSSYYRGLPAHERSRFPLFRRTRDSMLLYQDGSIHVRIRRAVARALHSSVSELGTALVARHVGELIARISDSRGDVDLVQGLAEPLPRLVLTGLLGLPPEEGESIYRQSVAINAALGGVISPHRVEQAEEALRVLRPRLSALAAEPPSGSVLGPLREAVREGELSEDELVASAVVLVTAGHETTTNLIGNTLIALGRNPDIQTLIVNKSIQIRNVVNEALRFEAPVQMTAREAREDLVIGQQPIKRGARVVLLWGSANRDPAAFLRPNAFDPRGPERLSALSFGVGPHHCLGARLARMQAEMAVRSLLDAVGPIRITQEPIWKNNFSFRGPVSLVVNVDRVA